MIHQSVRHFHAATSSSYTVLSQAAAAAPLTLPVKPPPEIPVLIFGATKEA
jgi:hypothetical protein